MIESKPARLGRVFSLRLEDGDRLPDCLEAFAARNDVKSALVALIGGAGGGRLVVGPKDGAAEKIEPLLASIADVHEIAALGTLFPDAEGTPRLHMHASAGRADVGLTGCVRPGVDIWRIAEAVVLEIEDAGMVRTLDPRFGFAVLTRAAG